MSKSDRHLDLDPDEFRALEQLLADAVVFTSRSTGLGRLQIKVNEVR